MAFLLSDLTKKRIYREVPWEDMTIRIGVDAATLTLNDYRAFQRLLREIRDAVPVIGEEAVADDPDAGEEAAADGAADVLAKMAAADRNIDRMVLLLTTYVKEWDLYDGPEAEAAKQAMPITAASIERLPFDLVVAMTNAVSNSMQVKDNKSKPGESGAGRSSGAPSSGPTSMTRRKTTKK